MSRLARRVSRKLRPRKLRPQTPKLQAPKLQTPKPQTLKPQNSNASSLYYSESKIELRNLQILNKMLEI